MSDYILVFRRIQDLPKPISQGVLKEYETGKNVLAICSKLEINRNIFYNWKKRYSGNVAELLCRFLGNLGPMEFIIVKYSEKFQIYLHRGNGILTKEVR